MPRAGGIFSLVPGYFAVDGTTIEVSQHNPPLEDIAQALTDSLPRDGSAPMTGNLAMGSNKITGLAAATLASDAVRFDQLPSITPTTATLTAGTDAQGQGPITTDQVTITTAAANPSGATLPTAVAGKRVIIANRGANPVNIYPATGAAIGALAANAPVLLAVNQSVEFFARSATQWEGQISQPLDTDLTQIAGISRARGDLIRGGASAWERVALGTNGQFLQSDGTDVVWGAGGPQLQASQATTSGTAFDFTGIPAGVKRVTMLLNRVSLSGTDFLLFQLGTAGGPVTSGYAAWGSGIASGAVAGGGSTSGIPLKGTTVAGGQSGRFVAERLAPGSNIWVCSYNGVRISALPTTSDASANAGGDVDLGAELTQIRLTSSGTNTFDSGAVGASWES